MERQERLEIANKFILAISEHGRKFFRYNDRIGCFSIKRGHIYWECEWTQKSIYLSYRFWRFHHGGTLRHLVNALADFIRGKSELPLNHLGPWPDWLCEGDLWGYVFIEMEEVRKKCRLLSENIVSSLPA